MKESFFVNFLQQFKYDYFFIKLEIEKGDYEKSKVRVVILHYLK